MLDSIGRQRTATGLAARNQVVPPSTGLKLSTWLMRRGCDQRTISRVVNGNRWRYGNWRPSYRAVLLVDGREDTVADLPIAAD